MAYFKNWKCGSYRFSANTRKDYSYDELKEYFVIDGSEVVYCKKSFGDCEAGKYYLVYDGMFYGCGFVVRDWHGFDSWCGKEYMKDEQEVYRRSIGLRTITSISDDHFQFVNVEW